MIEQNLSLRKVRTKPNSAGRSGGGAVLDVTPSSDASKQMGMICWLATEGGRKCPQCGRYAKPETLGNLSFYTTGSIVARISMYGHLPGYGCNQSLSQKV